jgi:hypothetical protein
MAQLRINAAAIRPGGRQDRLRRPAPLILVRWASGHEGSTSRPGAKLKADRAARAEAEVVIQRWNDQLSRGRDMLWAPTIRAALLAGTPWLDVFCPGGGTSRAIDLRTVDRHPLAAALEPISSTKATIA